MDVADTALKIPLEFNIVIWTWKMGEISNCPKMQIGIHFSHSQCF